jgi:N-acetylglucosamine transport system permease protein
MKAEAKTEAVSGQTTIAKSVPGGVSSVTPRFMRGVRHSLIYLGLVLLAIMYVFPLLWVISSSLKSEADHILHPQRLIPQALCFENYSKAWREAEIGVFFVNSVISTVATTVLTLLVSAMAAYILGRFIFRGRNFIHTLFLAGLMLPLWLGYIPLFFLARDLHLTNNLAGYIIINVGRRLAFTLFVLTPFFASLPAEMEEAAVIDGAKPFGVFWRVMLPLAQPGLLTVSIFNILGMWNEFNLALILLYDANVRTVPLGIARLFIQEGFRADWSELFAGLVIVMLPTLILYTVFSERFVKGITVGAIK